MRVTSNGPMQAILAGQLNEEVLLAKFEVKGATSGWRIYEANLSASCPGITDADVKDVLARRGKDSSAKAN